jgi:hypothetical protein
MNLNLNDGIPNKIFFNLPKGSNKRSELLFAVIKSLSNENIELTHKNVTINIPFIMTSVPVVAEERVLQDIANGVVSIFGTSSTSGINPPFRGKSRVVLNLDGTVNRYIVSKSMCITRTGDGINPFYVIDNDPNHYTMTGTKINSQGEEVVFFMMVFFLKEDGIYIDAFCGNNDEEPRLPGCGIGIDIFLWICKIFNRGVMNITPNNMRTNKLSQDDMKPISWCGLSAVKTAVMWWRNFFFRCTDTDKYNNCLKKNGLYNMELSFSQELAYGLKQSSSKSPTTTSLKKTSSSINDGQASYGNTRNDSDEQDDDVVNPVDTVNPDTPINTSNKQKRRNDSDFTSSKIPSTEIELDLAPDNKLLIERENLVDFSKLRELRGQFLEGPENQRGNPIRRGDSQYSDDDDGDWEDIEEEEGGDSQDDNEEAVGLVGEGGRRKSKKMKRRNTKRRKVKRRKTIKNLKKGIKQTKRNTRRRRSRRNL